MAINDDLTLVLGHVDDTKIPVKFILQQTCTAEFYSGHPTRILEGILPEILKHAPFATILLKKF